ncbi:hypothetical protein Nepgr_004700 [Nepenthes gracilis]|uniref:Uncharacterized protein n=1 Tax=Nepenthes gracilis TaxID=150966 RepID=A0AAD3S1U4_NEPGR|nr:hypothetical protein Nepgr_004700 [Nepenthes gracilis]
MGGSVVAVLECQPGGGSETMVVMGAIEKVVRQRKAGEEGEEMRSRAKKLREMSWRATENGGSSYSFISTLVEGLSSYHLLQNCGIGSLCESLPVSVFSF